MRLLLLNAIDPEAVELYEDAGSRLRERGLDVGVLHETPAPLPEGTEPEWDVVVTNFKRADVTTAARVVYGGTPMPRPTTLGWLEAAGVPTMAWTTAANRSEVWRLFRRWDVDRLILKPSFTFGGNGVCVFGRRSVPRMRWNPEIDVICREVDPDDGDVYKVELMAGSVLVSWVSESPPIRDLFADRRGHGIPGAYGDRVRWDPPEALAQPLCELSARMADQGYGHMSVDLMRTRDGEFVAIELNNFSVAIWWTKQFEDFRERHADAIHRLALAARVG
ncbi:hypothetical protein ACE2AJ_04130 [Aquihabitans daechungensis]|uniref:hypothetical protein n=1 Tax=Aquihabitans daechungensis TaxID=1052257 RepID=UPI003BA1CF23